VMSWRGLMEVFMGCGAAPRDLDLLEQANLMVQDPKELVFTPNKDIIVHTVDITQDLAEAKSWFLAQKYLRVGVMIGQMAHAVFRAEKKRDGEAAEDVEPALPSARFGPPEVVELCRGFNDGFQTEFQVHEGCMQDGEQEMSESIQKASGLFVTIKTKDDASRALQAIARMMDLVRAAFARCGALETDLDPVGEVMSMVEDPSHVVFTASKDIIVHGASITDEVAEFTFAWSEHNYQDCGFWLGVIHHAVLYPGVQRGEAAIGDEPTLLIA